MSPVPRPVISAWSAVSPFGIGSRYFAGGVAAGATAVARLDPEQWQVPHPHAATVPGFDVREVLGRKGTRSLDRVSALALATLGELLDAQERTRSVATGEDAALVLGTTAGSAKSMMDITRDTLTQDKPFFIDTARIPNAIMNSATAQCAIRHQIKGPNTTVAGGRAAGLFALRYAMRLLAAGRAGAVLCGGAEELTPERAWLDYHGRGERPPAAPGEGCALLLLEPGPAQGAAPAAPALAEVLAVETRVHTGGALAEAAADCLRRALARSGVAAAEVWAVSPAGDDGWDEAVRTVLGEAPDGRKPGGRKPGGPDPVRLPGDEAWGDAGAVTAAFQIASALAAAEHDPSARGRVAVVTSYDQDGVLGCALLRITAQDGYSGYESRTDDDDD